MGEPPPIPPDLWISGLAILAWMVIHVLCMAKLAKKEPDE